MITDTLFPKDCRDKYPRIRFFLGATLGLIMLLIIGWMLDEMVNPENSHVPFYWLGVILVLILGAFMSRCPACNGSLFTKWNPRSCPSCGSRLRDPDPELEEHSLVPYSTEKDSLLPYAVDLNLDGRTCLHLLDDTPECLRFRFRRGWFWRFILLAIASGATFLFCDSLVLDCRRNSNGTVDGQIHRVFLGWRLDSRSVKDLRGARIQETNHCYRVVLATSAGPLPLTKSYTAGLKQHQRIVDRINEYLKNPSQVRAVIVLPPGSTAWIVAGFLWFVALGGLVTRSDEFILDRCNRRFQIHRRGLFGTRVLEYSLENIEQFGVTRTYQQDRRKNHRGQNVEVYSIGFRLRSGAVVYLDPLPSQSGFRKKRAIANLLEKDRRSLAPSTRAPAPGDTGASDEMTFEASEKRCVVCGANCANEARCRDAENNYYHQRCYDALNKSF